MVQVSLHIVAVPPETSPLSHSMGFDDGQNHKPITRHFFSLDNCACIFNVQQVGTL